MKKLFPLLLGGVGIALEALVVPSLAHKLHVDTVDTSAVATG